MKPSGCQNEFVRVLQHGDPDATHWVCPECDFSVLVTDDTRLGPLFCADGSLLDAPADQATEMLLCSLDAAEAERVELTGRFR